MKVLVTGAAGFIGRRLVAALLEGAEGLPRVSTLAAVDTSAPDLDDPRVECKVGSVADQEFMDSVVDRDIDLVYHLAAVLSGQAEADFELGMRVNVDGTRHLLEACRRVRTPPRLVFTSTVAVFGGMLPDVVTDATAVTPQSSYGAEKAIGELLVGEYSRRGYVDGIVCRVPTVAIRPGAPNSALSSFVSGIVREPLTGIDAVCPVPIDTRLWISSPAVLTRNLLHAARVSARDLGSSRVVNLPGLTVTPGEMLDSLERFGGPAARARVRHQPDQRVIDVVCTWPGAFDIGRALGLGFVADQDIDSVVRQFIER